MAFDVDEMERDLVAADAAGDAELAQVIADRIREAEAAPDPTRNMGLGFLDILANASSAAVSPMAVYPYQAATAAMGFPVEDVKAGTERLRETLDYQPRTQIGQTAEDMAGTVGETVMSGLAGPLETIAEPLTNLWEEVPERGQLIAGGVAGSAEWIPALKGLGRLRYSKPSPLTGEIMELEPPTTGPLAERTGTTYEGGAAATREGAINARLAQEETTGALAQRPQYGERASQTAEGGTVPTVDLFGEPIDLTGAQARHIESGELKGLGAQEAGGRRQFGEDLQQEVYDFRQKQQQQVSATLDPKAARPSEEVALDPILSESRRRRGVADAAWDKVRQNENLYAFGPGQVDELVDSVLGSVRQSIPEFMQAPNALANVLREYRGRAMTLGDLDAMRRDIGFYAANATPQEATAIIGPMKRAFNDKLDEIISRPAGPGALGDVHQQAVQDSYSMLRQAVGSSRSDFSLREGSRMVGRRPVSEQVGKIINEIEAGTLVEEGGIKRILSNSGNINEVLGTVERELGAGARETLRKQLADTHLASTIENKITGGGALVAERGYKAIANLMDNALKSPQGRQLYNAAEIAEIRQSVEGLRALVPPIDITNYSGTSGALTYLTDAAAKFPIIGRVLGGPAKRMRAEQARRDIGFPGR